MARTYVVTLDVLVVHPDGSDRAIRAASTRPSEIAVLLPESAVTERDMILQAADIYADGDGVCGWKINEFTDGDGHVWSGEVGVFPLGVDRLGDDEFGKAGDGWPEVSAMLDKVDAKMSALIEEQNESTAAGRRLRKAAIAAMPGIATARTIAESLGRW